MRTTTAQLATEIMGYLSRHPSAEDTLEGIAEWWLMRQRIETVVAQVRTALSEMVEQGLVLRVTGADGTDRYRLNPDRDDHVDAPGEIPDGDPEGGAGNDR